ncbi:Protein pim1 [Vanrija pseudolonga]|uniref:Protein pim1 n=1 Tax=Vanrija pseudolonga TaxID=143232 RepID=A0AAF0Y1R5_9TREE|nr:Protein pim1 [Vanrija pseudolonga]
MATRTSSRTSSKPPSKAASSKPASKAAASKPSSKSEAKPPSKAAQADKPAAASGTKRNGPTEDKEAAPKPASKRRRVIEINAVAQAPEPQGLSVFVWGTGDMGQFGTGPDDLDEKPRPQLHKWFEEKKEDGELGSGPDKGGIETIAAGGMHTLAIDEKGQVRSWGINDNAALGRNTANVPDPNNAGSTLPAEDFETWPFVVDALAKDGFRAVKLAAGDSVSVALSDKGKLRAWGSFRSNDGVLGFDGVVGHSPFQFNPIPLHAFERIEVVDVAAGADHVLALTTEGHVYVWGNGQQNQLGRRVMERRRLNGLEPERLGLRNIVHIAAGQYHSFAVDKNGHVYAWGLNTFKQCGLEGRAGDEEMVIRPTVVNSLSPENHNGAKVVQVDGGEHHSLFLFDNGEVWGVGRNDAKELGLGPDHPAQAGLDERRADIKHEKEEELKAAQKKLDDVLATEKPNEDDKLAAETAVAAAQASLRVPSGEYVPEPVRIAFPPIGDYEDPPELEAWSDAPTTNPVASISAGTRHNLAVSRDGKVYAWGLGNQGQLGLGSAETADTPTWVRSKQLKPYKAVAASAGGQHCVLLGKLA